MAKKSVLNNEKTAVIYTRVSTADQAEHGVSLEAQEERLTAYALAVASMWQPVSATPPFPAPFPLEPARTEARSLPWSARERYGT